MDRRSGNGGCCGGFIPVLGAAELMDAQQAAMKEWWPNAGFVYVIQDVYTGMYKIGRTTNLDRRLKQLGVGVSANLIKAQFFYDCHEVEKRMHREYADSRLPGTEYFRLSCPPWLG